MASMFDCLQVAMHNDEIGLIRGREAQATYSELFERYRSGMPDGAAAIAAADDLKTATRAAARRRTHAMLARWRIMA